MPIQSAMTYFDRMANIQKLILEHRDGILSVGEVVEKSKGQTKFIRPTESLR